MLGVSELTRYPATLNSRFPILWILWILWIPDSQVLWIRGFQDSQILWILGFSDPLLKRKNLIGRDDRFPHCAKSHFKRIMLTYLLYFIWDYDYYAYLLTLLHMGL